MTNSPVKSKSTTYSFVFLSIFLGSLLIPFVTISAESTGLLDRFKGKALLINAYTESRLTLGDQVFNRSIVGTDDWLYLTDTYAMASYQKASPLSTAELQKIQQVLEAFQKQVESDGTLLLFVIPPDKQSIYPEHVPASVPRREGPSPLDQLITHLAENGSSFHILDLRPTLLEAKQTYPLYFATDSHWTPLGAFFAYQKIMETLQSSVTGLSPHLISDYNIVTHDPAPKDMPTIIGSSSLVEASFTLAPTYQPQAKIFSIEMPTQYGPSGLYFSYTNNKSAPTALVFTDSFFFTMLPFVSEHFSHAVYINYLATPNISYLTWYEQFRPDVVIFELIERNIKAIPGLFDN